EAGEVVVPSARIGKRGGAKQHAWRGDGLARDVLRRDALPALDRDLHDAAAADVEVERPRGDVRAAGDVVARRVRVRADVHGRADVAQRQVRAGVHVEVDGVHERRVAGP